MAYTTDIFDRATRELEKRRERALFEQQSLLDEISEKIPEITALQTQLAQIGLNISKVFFTSNDKQADIEKLKKESLEIQEKKKALLVKHGYSPDCTQIRYTCPICKDTGFINSRRCKCHTELLKELQREKIRKFAPLDECTFESFDTKYYPDEIMDNSVSPRLKAEKIKESCRKYAASFTKASPSLMFMGSTGLGKTHLSLAIANVAINKGFGVAYGTAQNILNDLQNENFGRTDNLKYNENDILNCDLLLIDDLGTEFKSSYSTACLYNIINSRIASKKPTIVSTNLTFDELEEKYDQRITSRLTGVYKTLILVGNDIRYIKK